jgi:TolB protein
MTWKSISVAAVAFCAAAVSPSGQSADDIAFASRRDGNWEIYAMDASGQRQRRLTRRDGEDRFPLWSPDHRQIAFASFAGERWELWVMDSDGTNQRRLASRRPEIHARLVP